MMNEDVAQSEWFEVDLGPVRGYTRFVDGPADEDSLRLLEAEAGPLPHSYLDLVRRMDGFEGFVGAVETGYYLVLHSCRDARERGRVSWMTELEANLFILGSNGGDAAILIDRSNREWVELPFLDFGDVPPNRLERRFRSFEAMLEELART